MKILLDENIPVQLAYYFSSPVSTVKNEGWAGVKNGQLLQLMHEHGFDILITMDQGIPHQNMLEKLKIHVVIFAAYNNKISSLVPLVKQFENIPSLEFVTIIRPQ